MAATVLVIDDHPANLELMEYLIREFGHQVITASTGEDGLKAAVENSPDLIVCDVQLPGIDGYEVARAIKGNESLLGIPLIAVTSYAMVGDKAKVMAAGFDGYLSKPIDPKTFVSELERYLPSPNRQTDLSPV